MSWLEEASEGNGYPFLELEPGHHTVMFRENEPREVLVDLNGNETRFYQLEVSVLSQKGKNITSEEYVWSTTSKRVLSLWKKVYRAGVDSMLNQAVRFEMVGEGMDKRYNVEGIEEAPKELRV